MDWASAPPRTQLAADYQPRVDAPPTIMCHGTQDNVVQTRYGKQSCERLQQLGVAVEWKTYPMAHSATPQELADVTQWLAARLP